VLCRVCELVRVGPCVAWAAGHSMAKHVCIRLLPKGMLCVLFQSCGK